MAGFFICLCLFVLKKSGSVGYWNGYVCSQVALLSLNEYSKSEMGFNIVTFRFQFAFQIFFTSDL